MSKWPISQNPPRVYRAQKVVAQLQRDARPKFAVKGSILKGPKELVTETLADYLGDRATEVFLVLYISIRNEVVGFTEFAGGAVASVEVHPAMVTVHNHPSGDALPSEADRELWKRLREVGLLMGVPVMDNLIVGDGEYFSEEEGGKSTFARKRSAP